MKLNIILFLLIFSFGLQAQNFIPNPGFEDVNICEKYKEQCSPKAWRNVLLKGFRFPELALLRNSREGIIPYKGSRAAIIPLYHKWRPNDRIFIQVPFLCELEKGKEYTFSFHYLLTEETTQSIGLIFSDSLGIRENIDELIGGTPDIEVTLDQDLEFKTWKTFSITYIAKGGEQGFIFGNFMEDKDIEHKPLVKLKRSSHYPKRITIWLDEFNLSPNEELENICDFNFNRKKIYDDSIRHIVRDVLIHKHIKEELEKAKLKKELIVENHHEEVIEEKGEVTEKPIIEEEVLSLIENRIVENQTFVLTNINFENNSARLLVSSYEGLNRILNKLRDNPQFRLQIIGHTDNVGSDKNNMILSRRRAESVAKYLIGNGISASRISSLGRGENEPAFNNATEEGRARNRRVEFIMN